MAEKNAQVFQFKITLDGTRPPVWRRIQVEDCSLAELHVCIQEALGWEDSHMHAFMIGGNAYGPMVESDAEWEDEVGVRLSDLEPRRGKRAAWKYEYDFGDSWRHTIEFEGYQRKAPRQEYPLCVEGARACPPEDIGGVWGYAELLEALADPKHKQSERFEWCGPFDPDAFDAGKATRRMRQFVRAT